MIYASYEYRKVIEYSSKDDPTRFCVPVESYIYHPQHIIHGQSWTIYGRTHEGFAVAIADCYGEEFAEFFCEKLNQKIKGE